MKMPNLVTRNKVDKQLNLITQTNFSIIEFMRYMSIEIEKVEGISEEVKKEIVKNCELTENHLVNMNVFFNKMNKSK
jgi:hypothetical protein